MENERVRMIEVNIRAHSKIDVDSPVNRERFLYMLSDGALILALLILQVPIAELRVAAAGLF